MSARSTIVLALAIAAALVSTTTAAAQDAARLWTNTENVRALAVAGEHLIVASDGGVERYDLATGERVRHYTTLDGLSENHVSAVSVLQGGRLRIRSTHAVCALTDSDRFACAEVDRHYDPTITPAEQLDGRRVTAELTHAGERFVGTSGAGVFRVREAAAPERLTPEGQICSNHITDVVTHDGAIVFGSFAEGLCVLDDVHATTFRRLATPFRMINDIESTPRGLFVATNTGLYRSRDGVSFERFYERVLVRGATGLAFDGVNLWATSPGSLQRIRIMRGNQRSRGWWRPAGASAIQDVALATDGRPGVWLVTEDRGAIRFEPGEGRDFDTRLFDRVAGLPTSWAYTVDAAADGTAYVGTLRHGLVAIASDGTHHTVPLPDAWLLRVRRTDDGALYVGTQGGAFVVPSAGADPVRVPHVPDPRVHEMVMIDQTLIVGTEGGTLALGSG